MTFVEKIQNATHNESAVLGIDGWLFTDFNSRDTLTSQLLQIPSAVASRRWIYYVPADGSQPVKILHAIEQHVLSHLPAQKTFTYYSREQLENILRELVGKKVALLCDSDIPIVSTVDGGFVQFLQNLGIEPVSAASLVQRCFGLISEAGIASHERASSMLYSIVAETWEFICSCYFKNKAFTERDISSFILEKFIAYGMVTDSPPLVAFGRNTANPHYQVPASGGATAVKGDVIQIDLWAKEKIALASDGSSSSKDCIYADISWVGVFDSEPSSKQIQVFDAICFARDSVIESLKTEKNATGAFLDKVARSCIEAKGFKSCIKHRTGHGIDVHCHGSGVNLDSVEFFDSRKILPGSCFSVEPGIYTEDFGMRTEINMYMNYSEDAVVSGNKFSAKYFERLGGIPQQKLLTVKDRF